MAEPVTALRSADIDLQIYLLNEASRLVIQHTIPLSTALAELKGYDESMVMLKAYTTGMLRGDLAGWESNQDGLRTTRPLIAKLRAGLKWIGQAVKVVEGDYNSQQLEAMRAGRETQLKGLYPGLDPDDQLRAGKETLSCWRAEAAAIVVLEGRRDYYMGLLGHLPCVSMEVVDAAVAVLGGYEPSSFWRGMSSDTDPVPHPKQEVLQLLYRPFSIVKTKR